MIQVTPSLPIQSAGYNGQLTAISATHAQIEWAEGKAPPQITSLIMTPGQPSEVVLDIVEANDKTNAKAHQNIVEFAPHSRPQVHAILNLMRKDQHIRLCATTDVEHSAKNNGFSDVELPIVSLPERSWDDVSTNTKFMGREFAAPILITGMTGGVAQASVINERLARAATMHNIPMGVGSQRLALEDAEHAAIFRLKDKFPKLFLIGNLGIGQLQAANYLELCERAVDMIDADALAIHINVLQELIQVEGDRNFCGIIAKIGEVQRRLKVPVLVKEVGAGLDVTTAQRLAELGITHFDVGGAGGTSWALIEGLRSSDPLIQRRGQIFRNWGIATADAIRSIRSALPQSSLVATGGIRDGLVVLKALYTGANMAGIGLPLMRAATENDEAPAKLLGAIIDELKIAKICSGI